jgi:2-methylisocitrate lyase-like PEP mutase family enzyme
VIPAELMAAKVKEAMAARRHPDFLIIARTNAVRASTMDDALRRGEAYKKAGADVLLLSRAHKPEQLRAIVADPSTPLLAAFAVWQKVYAHLADGFGIKREGALDWGRTEEAMLSAIDLEKLLAVERATVPKGQI